jgi:hypothetical protein
MSFNAETPNPKRVQGFLPAEGLGVSPNSLLYPPRVGGRGLKTRYFLEL